jgi:predicted dehydrogenase
MIKIAVIGIGKMGISHLSILGAHPEVDIVGVADTSNIMIDVLRKYTSFKMYSDYKKMIDEVKPQAAVVSVPTKYHASIVEHLLLCGIHVFVEKPFCLNPDEGDKLIKLAYQKRLVNQVGYHNRFIGTFEEVKRIINGGYLGNLYHFLGEAYGPVVVNKKLNTWRSSPEEGGGCLMDYASHVIDLIHYLIDPVCKIKGKLKKTIYSSQVDDSVCALLETENNISGLLSVNWSDETYRKMSTSVTISGINGKIIADSSELKVYFKTDNCPKSYSKGWNIKYINELTDSTDFYLRGEEYSLQLEHFIHNIKYPDKINKNNFQSAIKTDKVIELINKSQ